MTRTKYPGLDFIGYWGKTCKNLKVRRFIPVFYSFYNADIHTSHSGCLVTCVIAARYLQACLIVINALVGGRGRSLRDGEWGVLIHHFPSILPDVHQARRYFAFSIRWTSYTYGRCFKEVNILCRRWRRHLSNANIFVLSHYVSCFFWL